MKKLSLQVTFFTRKSRKYSSYKGKIDKVAPNRLRRRFDTNIPHQKITADTTELLKEAIDNYIEYYNKHRIKEKLGWMSPVEYKLSL